MNKQIPIPDPPIVPPRSICEKLHIVHAWKDITPDAIYLVYPSQYPDRREQCANCGLIRIFKAKEWVEYNQNEVKRDFLK